MNKKRIIIIDDDAAVREMLLEHLKNSFDVALCKNGGEGLIRLSTERFDLAIVDALLPDMKGEQIVQSIRGRSTTADLKILVISGHFRRDRDASELLGRWHVDAFLPKPIDLGLLDLGLAKLLGVEPKTEDPGKTMAHLRTHYVEMLSQETRETKVLVERLAMLPDQRAILSQVRMFAHRIHGSAGSYGFNEISNMATQIEVLMEGLLSRGAKVTLFEEKRIQVLLDGIDGSLRTTSAKHDSVTRVAQVKSSLLYVGSPDARSREVISEAKAHGIAAETARTLDECIRVAKQRPFDFLVLSLADVPFECLSLLATLRKVSRCHGIVMAAFGKLESTEARVRASREGIDLCFDNDTPAAKIVESLLERGRVGSLAKHRILLVDDDPSVVRHLELMFAGTEWEFHSLLRSDATLAETRKIEPEVILLDMEMPQVKGYDVCRALKTDPNLARIPVVMYSAFSDEAHRLRALRVGAVDLITKSCDESELKMRLRNLIASTGLPQVRPSETAIRQLRA